MRSANGPNEARGTTRGSAQVEHLVLVLTVAIAFAAAAVPLGARLLSYHAAIERVLALPIP